MEHVPAAAARDGLYRSLFREQGKPGVLSETFAFALACIRPALLCTLMVLLALGAGCNSGSGSSSSSNAAGSASQEGTSSTEDTALAQRAAVIFIEMEHMDIGKGTVEEVASADVTELTLDGCYAKIYWLVNTDATCDKFIETLQTALNTYATVDFYMIAHAGVQYFWGHFDNRFYVDDILALKGLDNIDHLRLAFLLGCHTWGLTDEFIEIGAKAAVGSDIVQQSWPFYPLFLYNFATRGYPLGKAVDASMTPLWDNFKVRGDTSLRLKS